MLAFIILIMTLFWFKITYYFYSSYIYIYIYNARKHGFLYFNNFLSDTSKSKILEKRVATSNWSKCEGLGRNGTK